MPAKVEDQVMTEVKKAFNPEFLNRLDEIILFTSLTDEDLLKIVYLLTEQINKNLVAKQIKIQIREDAARYILEKTCTDRSYGARPLRRALQKYIEDPLSEALIQGSLARPAEFEVYLGEARHLLPSDAACGSTRAPAAACGRGRRRPGGGGSCSARTGHSAVHVRAVDMYRLPLMVDLAETGVLRVKARMNTPSSRTS